MRRSVVRSFIWGSLALALGAAPLAAQAGTLQGTVADSGGATLPNASVSVEGTGLRGVTGANGGYEIRGVPRGPTRCGSASSATSRR